MFNTSKKYWQISLFLFCTLMALHSAPLYANTKLTSVVAIDNTRVFDPNAQLDGNGTEDDPYTCADIIKLCNSQEGECWVKGYVLGATNDRGKRTMHEKGNIVLSDVSTIVDQYDDEVHVPITFADDNVLQSELNVVDHPELVGTRIMLKGSFGKHYFDPSKRTAVPTTVGYVGGKPVMMRQGEPVLFYGIQYWGLDSWNEGNWDADIAEFKELGLNGVRLNIAWDHIEPFEGQFEFDDLCALMDKLEDAGLYVFLQFSQSAHSWKPAWFDVKYPLDDHAAFDNKGKKQYSRLSFASPALRSHYTNYIKKTIARVKDYSNVVAYSVYTEPHYASDANAQLLDYNAYNVAAFREWLAERYARVGDLNAAWGTAYASFDVVQPYTTDVLPTNWKEIESIKEFADWRIWNCVVKADFIGGVIAEAKKVDSDHLYSQNMMWKWSGDDFNYVSLDPEINYAYADILGINVYPTEGNVDKVSNSVNFIRTLHNNKKVVWVTEANTKNGNVPSELLNSYLEPAFNEGATGFVYYTYHGGASVGSDDSGTIEHYGVKDAAGNRKDSWNELKDYVDMYLKGHEQQLIDTPLPAVDCYMLWPMATKYVMHGDADYVLSQYDYLRELMASKGHNLAALSEVDFVAGRFDSTLPIIVPSMPIVDKQVGEKVRNYITAGGKYMICGRWGEYVWEDGGNCTQRQDGAVDPYIGITFNGFHEGVPSSKITVKADFGTLSSVGDKKIAQKKDMVLFDAPSGAISIAQWGTGDPALVLYDQGAGKVCYLGTHLLLEHSASKDFASRIIESFINYANQQLKSPSDSILFLMLNGYYSTN